MTDKTQTDLEVQINNQGLDPKKWKELLKKEFQVTSVEALQHLNKDDYQELEKHAGADWERRALAKLVNVDISTDLEVQIKNQGLDPKKWKELLKKEFQVTSVEALQHLNKDDYQKLEKHAGADWERRALAKLVNVDISTKSDLEVQIKNQGLDPKKWKELLKKEFQVTSVEALQHLNKDDYQMLEKHAEAQWERLALAKLVNVDISPKSDEDLEKKIEDSGLDTEKWKNILKEEYGITSLVSLQYLKKSDLRLLQKKTEKEWEKRALSRLLNTEIAPKMTQEDEKGALEMRQKISDGLGNVTKDLESHLKRIGRDELGNNDLKASADKSLSTLTKLMNKMDTLKSNSVKRTEWTPSDLIYRASEGGVFRGILFSNDVKDEQVYRGIILDKPVECCLLGPFLSMQEKSYTFQSSEHESSFESSLQTCGASYSAELHASYAGFSVEAGGGTASSSTDSNKTSRAKAESYGSVIKQTFVPMASFEFTHTQLKLSEDALHVLKEIDDFISRDLIRRQMVVLLQSQAIKFLQRFGSHVNGSVVHFGGIHCVKASSHEVHSNQKKSKFNEMSRSIDAHVKASFSFYGGGGFSASHNNSDARESTGTHETNTSDIDIAVQMIGGPQEACSIPEWKRGLDENQSTWSVIDRGQASDFIPVWNIIMDNHFKNFNDPMGLACILRECWGEMVASQARGKGARVDHPKWWDDERIDDLVKNGKEWKSFDITDVTQLWAVKSLENLLKRKKSLTTSENYEEQESQIKVKCERLSSLMDEYMEEEQADDLWKAFGTELISDRPKKETGGRRVAPHIIGELKRIYKNKEEEARRQEAACRTNKLELDDFLTKGQRIISKNGKYEAIFQDDGNFVVYESPEGVPIWASDTWGKRNADKVIMQGDCNLVMYDTKGTALWQSNTYMPNCQACCLTMQDDGNLVIYRDNKEIWSGKQK